MPLTAAQLDTLGVITKISSSLSLIGCACIVIEFARSRSSFNSFMGRIILALCATDALDCIFKSIGRWGLAAGNSSLLCQLQAAAIQYSILESALLIWALAISAVYISVFRGSADVLRRLEWPMIATCVCIPIPTAIVPIFLTPINGVRMFGDADQWCWIAKPYAIYQIYLWFVWLWTVMAFNTAAFLIARSVISAQLQANALLRTESPGDAARRLLLKRMLAYLLSFVIAWTPSTINRLVQLTLGTSVFELSVWQSIFSPMRGMANCIAYFYASRPDKRGATQLRTMGCVLGPLSRADGSARFSFGDSSVLCSVYGPAPVRTRDEKLDQATVSVVFNPVSGVSGTQERLYERYIREVVEALVLSAMHPRTAINITAQVLANDGSILATAMNAVLLALVDAGVPMQATCAAAHAIINRDGSLLLDPVALEVEEGQSAHTFVFDTAADGILAVDSAGLFTQEEFDACFELTSMAAKTVLAFMRKAIERKIIKEQQS
ncbi:exosome non-catalytic core subunit rrp46 [Polyrhizophydium stewartii]|uniref:Exosome non-catalytic core subunit rrp46 n=1 Tax=Polyrhizophydium stewartii TaxID=2732419 RepID=A0ABR4N457_9FUNG